MPRLALITAFLGRTKDRFHEYNEPLGFADKVALAASIDGLSGVECIYPYEVQDPLATRDLLARHGLRFAAVNVNVKAEPAFRSGGLTSADPGVRAHAVRLIKEAKDFAEAAGADKVTCCPLGDGYEFSFEADYAVIWKRLVETFGEAADYKRSIPLFIEFKPSETRGRCYLDDTAKTLLLIRDIGIRELGVTLDFGHAVYGDSNPAEELALLAGSGHPYYIHINDNDGKWDWDYFCGTKHFVEYAEFLWYLRRYGYDDFLTSDTSPTRWDIRGTFEANNRITRKLWAKLDELDALGLGRHVGSGDYLATWRFLEQHLLGLK